MFKEPCSIHVPLNQILNMIITSFESLPSMTEVILEKLEGHGNLLQTIDPVITVLTVFAQIKCGMWKRNGIYLVEGQHHYYHDPSINAHNKSNDLMLLQIACSIIPGECTPQCENFRIFLSLGFYVKLTSRDSRSAKSAIFTHLGALNFDFHEFLHFLEG